MFSKHCTTYQIQFHGQLLCCLWPESIQKEKKPYRSTLCSSLPPPSPIFHASISHILPCNKAEIKRLAGQLAYNESWREPFASGVVGLQRMWYLKTMRSGFICEGAGLPFARLPHGFVCRRCWMCLKLIHRRTIAFCISAWSYGQIWCLRGMRCAGSHMGPILARSQLCTPSTCHIWTGLSTVMGQEDSFNLEFGGCHEYYYQPKICHVSFRHICLLCIVPSAAEAMTNLAGRGFGDTPALKDWARITGVDICFSLCCPAVNKTFSWQRHCSAHRKVYYSSQSGVYFAFGQLFAHKEGAAYSQHILKSISSSPCAQWRHIMG